MSNTATATEVVPFAQKSEPERIYDWKMIRLVNEGFKLNLAQTIANNEDADWRLAVDLLQIGCDPTLAAVICGALERNYDS